MSNVTVRLSPRKVSCRYTTACHPSATLMEEIQSVHKLLTKELVGAVLRIGLRLVFHPLEIQHIVDKGPVRTAVVRARKYDDAGSRDGIGRIAAACEQQQHEE